MSTSQQFYLPDLLAICDFKGSTNPHYEKAGAESSLWVSKYKLFTNRKRLFFVLGSNELLVSHTFPYAAYEQFRTCCDFVNLLFTIDEVSDDQTGEDARLTGLSVINVLRNPEWDDGSALAKMTREFRERLTCYAGPGSLRRFIKHCENYVDAVAKEAEYRERNEVLDIDAYITLRRENSAVRVTLGLIESCLGIDLPNEVFEDPVLLRLHLAATDMVCWSNDVYSYNMEQAKGHTTNNIMTVLMKAKNFSIQEAADYVGVYFKGLMDGFRADKRQLRSWGPSVDEAVAGYVRGLECWVIGNLEWSLETQRYFGAVVAEVKKTRLVILRPRENEEDL